MTGYLDELMVVAVMMTALVLNLAVHNDRQIPESTVMAAGQRLQMMGQLLVAVRLCWAVIEVGDSSLELPMFFVLMLWGLGSIMCNLDHIARRWGREISDLLKPSVHYERRKHPR